MRQLVVAWVLIGAAWVGMPAQAQGQDARAQWQRILQQAQQLDSAKRYAELKVLADRMVASAPTYFYGYMYRSRAEYGLWRVADSLKSANKAYETFMALPESYRQRGAVTLFGILQQRVTINTVLGELETILEDCDTMDRSFKGDPYPAYIRARAYHLQGKLDKAKAAIEETYRRNKAPNRLRGTYNHYFGWEKVEILRKLGEHEAAKAAAEELARTHAFGHIALARVHGMPKDAAKRDLRAAEIAYRRLAGSPFMRSLYSYRTRAMLYRFYTGYNQYAWSVFEYEKISWGQRTSEEDYFHALSAIEVGNRERAIDRMVAACRRNAGYKARLDREFAGIAKDVRSRLGDLQGAATAEERIEVAQDRELADHLLAEITGFVRSFRFEQAMAQLEDLDGLKGSAQAEAEAQKQRIGAYLALKKKLIKAISNGRLNGTKLELPSLAKHDARIVKADSKRYHLKLGKQGKTSALWAALPFKARFELLMKNKPSAKELLTLAQLAWETDDDRAAEKALLAAWKTSSARERIDQLLTEARGRRPEGGWAVFKGEFVSGADKAQLDKGLVRFRGEWVTKKDKHHLEKNHVKVNGKWVPLTKEQMAQRGYVNYQGNWMTQDEVAALRKDWKHAFEAESAHYKIKTNVSQRFADRLAVAMEDAYAAYKQLFGAEPKGTQKMTMKAFRTYEDYRAYCERTGNMSSINAAGFAPSEPRTGCGYDKLKDENSLLKTMIHEGAHLYYSLATGGRCPSWLAEGMATYFEGFTADEQGKLTFTYRAKLRLYGIKRAVGSSKHIPLKELMSSNAGVLINTNAEKALVFYAQCWALFAFIQQDEQLKGPFNEAMMKAGRGAKVKLDKVLGISLDQLEDRFLAFVKKQ